MEGASAETGPPLRYMSELGPNSDLTAPKCDFRYTSESRLNSDIAGGPKRADIVAKVFLG